MKWFKFEPQEEENSESEMSPILVYLSPEALKHSFVVEDFSTFQNTPECVPGGRLFEVSRQYSYKLRQVADLVEEPLEDDNLKSKTRRDFHSEIKPNKKLGSQNQDIMDDPIQNTSFTDPSFLEPESNTEKTFGPQEKINSEQVPFKDLESLFAK